MESKSANALKKLEAKGLKFTNYDFQMEIVDRNLKTITLFIEAGIDVNGLDDGLSPLLGLASSQKGDRNCEVAELLINAGADVNFANKDGLTPLRMAKYHKHLALLQLLIAHGADNPISGKSEITNIVERLELLEDKFGIVISGLYASCDSRPYNIPPDHVVIINFDINSLAGGELERNLQINASAYNTAGQLLSTDNVFIIKNFIGFESKKISFMSLDQAPTKIRLFPSSL